MPAMMSLADAKDASSSSTRLFRLPVVKAIIAQIVQVVAFLHDWGIVHACMYLQYISSFMSNWLN